MPLSTPNQRRVSWLALVLAVVSAAATAQSSTTDDLMQRPENVRTDYARVLKVEPVYETLRATTAKKVCEEVKVVAAQSAPEGSGWSRAWKSVKDVFSGEEEKKPSPATTTVQRCKTVHVPRTFQRPIAYDVDYMYKGVKYRSRLPEDPGSRVRIRIAVQPIGAEQVASP